MKRPTAARVTPAGFGAAGPAAAGAAAAAGSGVARVAQSVGRGAFAAAGPGRVGAAAPNAAQTPRRSPGDALPAPLVWVFDGPFAQCLADLEDTLRRAIVMLGDVGAVALQIELSLPALQCRVRAGDALQPDWSRFVDRLARYGLPFAPRVRYQEAPGPLATLVIAYRD